MLTKEENLRLFNKRISELNLNKKIVLSFDFDELVVPVHLTKIVTTNISRPIDQKLLDKLGSCSFEGIKYLNSLMYGCSLEEYKQVRDQIVKETCWTEGFDQLLSTLVKRYSVIFISSGLKDICEAKLKEVGFDSKNIIAGELKIEKNKLVGSDLVISEELKGDIITALKKNHKVMAIGHSLGDKAMLDNSEVSISVNSKIPDLAQFKVKSADELLKVIQNNS